MIEIQNLKFAYEDMANPLLNGVDLTLDRGCWLALVGSNGGGKSTLARMVNGLLQPDSGRVLVDGLCTANEEELWQIRERVAFLFQNPDHQFIATSVEDDVAFGLENLGLAPQEIRILFMVFPAACLNFTYCRTAKLSGSFFFSASN